MFGHDRSNIIAILRDTDSTIIEEKSYILFVCQPIQLLPVFVIIRRLCISSAGRSKFFLQVSQFFVRTCLDTATQMYTYLRTVVTSDNGTVVDQRDLASESGSRYRRTHPGNPGPYDNQVILSCESRGIRQTQCLAPESFQLFYI